MDLDELRRALRGYEGGETFTMPAPAGEVWKPVAELFEASLAGRTLRITNASFPVDTGAAVITYGGDASLFPWAGEQAQVPLGVTASFSLDATGTPQVQIRASAPAGWKMTDSLTGLETSMLAAVEWEHAGFLLASAPVSGPAYPGPVEAGINFSGEVGLSGPFAYASPPLDTPDARTVAGKIALGDASKPIPVMALSCPQPRTTTIAGVALAVGARLETLYRSFEEQPLSASLEFIGIAGSLRIGATTAELRIPLLPGGGMMPMELSKPVPLTSLADLRALAGTELEIPVEVASPGDLELKQLRMPIASGVAGSLERPSVWFDIGLAGPPWELLPNGILVLKDVGMQTQVSFGFADGISVSTSLYGTVMVTDELQLLASLTVPGLEVGIRLADGRTADVQKLMEQLMEKLTGRAFAPPLLGMKLSQLELVASARTREFQLLTAITTNWNLELGKYHGKKLTVLGLEDLSMMIAYDGSVLSGWIEAGLKIGDAGMYALASTGGGEEAGWDLSGGLLPGEELKIIPLVKAFMEPDGEVLGRDEYGLTDLSITVLDLALSLDSSNKATTYRIQAAISTTWRFSLFGGNPLQIAAGVDLTGERIKPTEDAMEVHGRVYGSLSAFGLLIEIAYHFAKENNTLTFGVWYGNRGIEASLVKTKDKEENEHRVLTVRLGDLSLGEILDFLIGLAVPGEKRRLPSPWDFLYKIDFRNLSLSVDLDTYETSLDYWVRLDLGFASVTKVGLTYTRDSGEGKVLMKVSGEFLGQRYGTDPDQLEAGEGASEPLTWDVIGEQAPPVPGKSTLIDIRYVGLGQHVALPVPDSELKTVSQAIEALKKSMGPPSGGGSPLGGKETAGLRYDANSKWLFGLEAELVETVTLSAILYDPHLYGALLELKGERAGSLAGLRAELVYRRITDQIGEFSVDLQIPDRYRSWEFGEVSITLGLIHVDVYTNGNFRVDVGFPAKADFSRAFTVQVFPFIGRGGFYFAYLTGATSERVPKIGNGSFDPVIEAGVGLSLGVGKEIRKGPLKAGLSLEVCAIFEGVYAPFHPYKASAPDGTYFWFQGTAEIIGKLYGEVDFAILKASITIVARAKATITMEAHRASHVELELEVTAEASIKILFVRIHFRFRTHLDASFTLGEDTPAPWLEEKPQPLASGQPLLRQQRSQAPRRRLAAPARRARPPLTATPSKWTPEKVTEASVQLQFLPAFTVAKGAGGANQVEIVLMLGSENAIAPGARTYEEIAAPATEHLHAEGGEAPFATLVRTFLLWAAKAGAGVGVGERITAAQLVEISESLHDPDFVAETFAYSNLREFLEKNLVFELLGFPSGTAEPAPTSMTFFPMVPAMTATVTQEGETTVRPYESYRQASPAYSRNLAAYFEQLATDYRAEAADPLAPRSEGDEEVAAGEGDAESLARIVFGEYFALLTRTAVQAAIDLLAALPYPYAAKSSPSLSAIAAELRREFGTVPVVLQVADGQTPEGLAAEHGLEPAEVAAAFANGLAEDGATVELEAGPTALGIAEANQGVLLRGVTFTAEGLTYQVRAGQTLAAIAEALKDLSSPGALTAAAIGAANTGPGFLRPGATLTVPAYTYTRVDGESDAFLKAFFEVRKGVERPANAAWYEQAISGLNEGTLKWVKGESITVPSGPLKDTEPLTYIVHEGDTLERVAMTFAIYQHAGGGTGSPSTSPTYPVPEQQYVVGSTDTFTTVTESFPELGEVDLIAANLTTDVLEPLAIAVLPAFEAKVPEDKLTLATLAEAFDLALPDLVKLVEDTPALFVASHEAKPTVLTVRDLPAAPVEKLIAEVSAQGNEIATQVSRFLLHGLLVPPVEDEEFTRLSPEEVCAGKYEGPLEGLYEAAGFQIGWPATDKPVTVELSSGAGWLKLYKAKVEAGKVVKAEEAPTDLLATTIEKAEPFSGWLPATSLALETTASELPLLEARDLHFELASTIHWQAAEHPVLVQPPGASPGEPSIWLLPESLRRAAAGATGEPTPAFALRSLPLTAPAGAEGKDLEDYAWATHLTFNVHRVAAPPSQEAKGPGPQWLPTTYSIDGTDEAGEGVLRELWTHLAALGAGGAKLQLLFPPAPGPGGQSGLISGATAAAPPYILKTNLSTETRQRLTAAAAGGNFDPPEVFSATLGEAARFTEFLWQAATVVAGGFYLHYEVDGRGLPDSAFDESGRATLTLLCLLDSQTGSAAERGLYAFNTCAVVNDAVDAAAAQVYAVQTGGTPPKVAVATMPPGNVGFALDRPNPLPSESEPNETQRTQLLYNLFGWLVSAGGGFATGNRGLPVGPAGPRTGEEETAIWHYERAIQAFGLAGEAGQVPQHCPALPASTADPYAGISAAAKLAVGFEPRDSFGNTATASGVPGQLSLPVRYTDPVVAVGEWPGATLSYLVEPASVEGGKPSLSIALALQAAAYLPAPGVETAPALRAASAHAMRYERVLYQLRRPKVTVSAGTTLAPGSALPLSRARFTGFAASAYVFTSQLAGLEPVREETKAGDSLSGFAGEFSVTPADLLAANADLEPSALFAGKVEVPKLERVKVGETIEAFATRVRRVAVELLEESANAGVPVPAGASVKVPPVEFESDGSSTIAQMAATAGCAPADIGVANQTAEELLETGVQWVVRGTAVISGSTSTFAGLVADFALAGVQTTAGEIAAANAETASVFKKSEPAAPVTYRVDRYTVPVATTVAGLVAEQFGDDTEKFVEHNEDVTGVLEANAQLQVGMEETDPISDLSLRAWVERGLAISIGRFAEANPSAAFKAGVELMLPALLRPGALTAVPYALPEGRSLAEVATLFATTATALGGSIRDIGGLFVPEEKVTVGTAEASTCAEDSLATLLAKLPAGTKLADLIDAVAPRTDLLRPGAPIVCPVPTVAAGADSLRTMAEGLRLEAEWGLDAVALGWANAALDGFLDPEKQVAWEGRQLKVGPHGTLTSLYQRLAPAVDFAEFLAAIAGQSLLKPGAKAILPAPGATDTAPLPATPGKPGKPTTIAALQAEVTIARPPAEVATGAAADVAAGSSPVPAHSDGKPASYHAFAASLEAAYEGNLKLGVGGATENAPGRLHMVRVNEAPDKAICSVSVTQAPVFFALPSLCRELISRTVTVREYRSAATEPLPAQRVEKTFRAVDVQAWARSVLAAIDLALSAPYAATAFQLTREPSGASVPFDSLVAAKRKLSEKIPEQLTKIVPAAVGSAGEAQKALRQTLAANLTAGWDVAAMVQLPTSVSASFSGQGEDRGRHRLAGKPLPQLVPLGETDTLAGLAARFKVEVGAVAEALGGIPNLLQEKVKLGDWEVGKHSTLEDGATALGISLAELGRRFKDTQPLFRPEITVTIAALSAPAGSEDSLATMADRLATGVSFLAVCNQDASGLLEGTIEVGEEKYVTTPQTTLADVARDSHRSVEELAEGIAGQQVLAPGGTFHLLAPLPEHSLTASKIDLDAASGYLNLQLGLAAPERYRRLLLPLDFEPTGLEYEIEQSAAHGYETSEWLQMVTPLTAKTKPMETSLGQLEVPIPLRAYPTPPRLIGQTATPAPLLERTPAAAPREEIESAKKWTYTAMFETETAAQDVVELEVGVNWEPAAVQPLGDTIDPFRALAEFAVNAAAVEADLAKLLLPPEKLKPGSPDEKKAKSAVVALSEIAETVAENWGPINPEPPSQNGESRLEPAAKYKFTLESRTWSEGEKTFVDALILTKPSNGWGPAGRKPTLGYIDDEGKLQTMAPKAGSGQRLEYQPPSRLTAFGRRVFAIGYEGLDALAVQNARLTIVVARNAELLPGRATDPAFVYRTPEIHFPEIAMPALVRSQPIAIGSGAPGGFANAVSEAFGALLSTSEEEARTRHKLTVRYGYRVTPPEDDGGEGIEVLSPVVFRPLFAYTDEIPQTLGTAVREWLAENPPPPGVSALLSLELATFSSVLPERQQPLVELDRLDYALTG